jgi:hypothetical protein
MTSKVQKFIDFLNVKTQEILDYKTQINNDMMSYSDIYENIILEDTSQEYNRCCVFIAYISTSLTRMENQIVTLRAKIDTYKQLEPSREQNFKQKHMEQIEKHKKKDLVLLTLNLKTLNRMLSKFKWDIIQLASEKGINIDNPLEHIKIKIAHLVNNEILPTKIYNDVFRYNDIIQFSAQSTNKSATVLEYLAKFEESCSKKELNYQAFIENVVLFENLYSILQEAFQTIRNFAESNNAQHVFLTTLGDFETDVSNNYAAVIAKKTAIINDNLAFKQCKESYTLQMQQCTNKDHVYLYHYFYNQNIQHLLHFLLQITSCLKNNSSEHYQKAISIILKDVCDSLKDPNNQPMYYNKMSISKLIIAHDIQVVRHAPEKGVRYVLSDIFNLFQTALNGLSNDENQKKQICTRFAMFYKLGLYSQITLDRINQKETIPNCIFTDCVSKIGVNNIAIFLNLYIRNKSDYIITQLIDMTIEPLEINQSHFEASLSLLNEWSHILIPVHSKDGFWLLLLTHKSNDYSVVVLNPTNRHNENLNHQYEISKILLGINAANSTIWPDATQPTISMGQLYPTITNTDDPNGGLALVMHLLTRENIKYDDPFIETLINSDIALLQNIHDMYFIYDFLLRVITPNENDDFIQNASSSTDNTYNNDMKQCQIKLIQSEIAIKMYFILNN